MYGQLRPGIIFNKSLSRWRIKLDFINNWEDSEPNYERAKHKDLRLSVVLSRNHAYYEFL